MPIALASEAAGCRLNQEGPELVPACGYVAGINRGFMSVTIPAEFGGHNTYFVRRQCSMY